MQRYTCVLTGNDVILLSINFIDIDEDILDTVSKACITYLISESAVILYLLQVREILILSYSGKFLRGPIFADGRSLDLTFADVCTDAHHVLYNHRS